MNQELKIQLNQIEAYLDNLETALEIIKKQQYLQIKELADILSDINYYLIDLYKDYKKGWGYYK